VRDNRLDSRVVRRVALLSMVLLGFVVAGCGSSTSYSLENTRACLQSRGVQIGGPLDFVASTATGGALVANLGDNTVKIVFGQTENDATQIERAYDHFAAQNVKAGLPDVLRRYKNAVMLWHEHPVDTDLGLVSGCLK
jgi:hypothetical protein